MCLNLISWSTELTRIKVVSALQASCFALASGSTYFSKKYDSPTQPVLSDGAYAGIVIGGFFLILGAAFLTYLIIKERQGQPLFVPLNSLRDRDDEEDYDEEHQSKSKKGNDNRNEVVSAGESQL